MLDDLRPARKRYRVVRAHKRGAFLGLLLLLSAAVYAASASGMSERHSSVLHFYEGPGARVFIDNPPTGKAPTVGDVFIYTYPILTRHGRRVGRDHQVCTVIGSLILQCTGTLQLPNGQLMLHRLGTAASSTSQAAVVGGTGQFAGARGVATTRSSGQRTTIDITLQ